MAKSRADKRVGPEVGRAQPASSFRTGASLGSHIRALHEALSTMIDHLTDVPSERRVRLRNVRAALERAYPRELKVSEIDLAWENDDETTLSD